jgi:hypothetical protein
MIFRDALATPPSISRADVSQPQLGAIHTLPEFRAIVDSDPMTPADRETLVEQAAIMIDGVYAHLLQKRAMYGSDPSQLLRLLQRRFPQLTDRQFHTELLRIFIDLRDLHTNYILPRPYQGPDGPSQGPFAFLGILLEQYWQDGEPHWNGSPIALAVARNGELDAGSNPAARLARGGQRRAPLAGAEAPPSHLLGLDLRTELVRAVKKRMFAPEVVADERRRAVGEALPPSHAQGAGEVFPSSRTEIAASTVTTAHGTFGHLRIFTFELEQHHPNIGDDLDEFFAEVKRLLSVMPPEGLILDVRGNGGGYVYIAEAMLQFFTPRRIQPEPTQFINTPLTAELCAAVKDLNAWGASINASIETGAQYSSAIPLYGEDSEYAVNDTGQRYHGPVVLVTDALCYSATDFFAAGFQDHEIGTVPGVDDNTGAGGANVWDFATLLKDWPDGPFKPLPGGADFRVALRRSLRVGKRWGGQAIEDLGVIPDVR